MDFYLDLIKGLLLAMKGSVILRLNMKSDLEEVA